MVEVYVEYMARKSMDHPRQEHALTVTSLSAGMEQMIARSTELIASNPQLISKWKSVKEELLDTRCLKVPAVKRLPVARFAKRLTK